MTPPAAHTRRTAQARRLLGCAMKTARCAFTPATRMTSTRPEAASRRLPVPFSRGVSASCASSSSEPGMFQDSGSASRCGSKIVWDRFGFLVLSQLSPIVEQYAVEIRSLYSGAAMLDSVNLLPQRQASHNPFFGETIMSGTAGTSGRFPRTA